MAFPLLIPIAAGVAGLVGGVTLSGGIRDLGKFVVIGGVVYYLVKRG